MISEYSKALATIVVAGLAVSTAQEKLEKKHQQTLVIGCSSVNELIKGRISSVQRRGTQDQN